MGLCFTRAREVPISSSSPDRSPPHQYQRPPKNATLSPQPLPPKPKPVFPSKTVTIESSSPEIGAVLRKPICDITSIYELDKELGRGQFGITYLCTEKATGLKFACKSISKRKLVKAKDIEDVRREILILQHLTGQPNIVEFKGTYEDKQNLHLVMELCSGGELFDRIIAKGSYSERAAASPGRKIVTVVHVCHFYDDA